MTALSIKKNITSGCYVLRYLASVKLESLATVLWPCQLFMVCLCIHTNMYLHSFGFFFFFFRFFFLRSLTSLFLFKSRFLADVKKLMELHQLMTPKNNPFLLKYRIMPLMVFLLSLCVLAEVYLYDTLCFYRTQMCWKNAVRDGENILSIHLSIHVSIRPPIQSFTQ